MAQFTVWSAHFDEETEVTREVAEVTRTDKRVAEDDAQLIRSVLHRKAWVSERL